MLKLGLCCGGGLCCALLGGALWLGGGTTVLGEVAELAVAKVEANDPSRFLENPEVREVVERQTPLTSVPLQPYGPFYLVDVTINDKGPFKFVIDSATTSTVLDVSVAQELGLVPAGASEDSLSGLELGSLQLGRAKFNAVSAKAFNLTDVWGEGAPSGVLGFDLFGDRLVTLDLPLQKLTVENGELPAPDGKEVLAYKVHSVEDPLGERLVPTIDIAVGGRSMSVELSPLGFGTLALPKEQMEKLPLASEAGVIGHTRTQDGTFPILGGSLQGDMTVGRHRFENPSVFFSESFEYPSLGAGTLEPFVITFDLARNRVRLDRPSGRANPLVVKAAGLAPQSGSGEAIKSLFNANVDRVRLMVLLSPT